jgi:hypothetical protein
MNAQVFDSTLKGRGKIYGWKGTVPHTAKVTDYQDRNLIFAVQAKVGGLKQLQPMRRWGILSPGKPFNPLVLVSSIGNARDIITR